jgi:predicted RNase H-like nuclease (RuvC/YqgF family)
MEKEQVIKDIEELLEGHCSLDYKHSEPICGYDTIKDALALIKQQEGTIKSQAIFIENLKTGIEKLTEENEKLLTALANYDRLIDIRIAEEYYTAEAYEELREENERLRKNLETFKGKQKSLQKQIEILAKENHLLLSKDFDITVGECHIVFSNGKKGNIYTFTEKDQIAKEMLEDEK